MSKVRSFEDVKLLGMSAMMLALAYSFLPAEAKDKISPGHLNQEIDREANRQCWSQFNHQAALPLQQDYVIPMQHINDCYHQAVTNMTAKKDNVDGGDIILYTGTLFFAAFGLWGVSSATRNLIRGRKDTPAPEP